MNVLVVSAYNSPQSFNAALHNVALGALERAGHTVAVASLYAQGFNPTADRTDFTVQSGVNANYMFEQQRTANTGSGFSPDITAEMEKVKNADIILFQFPLWWGSAPAVLKGWFDRVFAMGFAWDADHRYDNGLLAGKRAALCVTTGDPSSYYAPDGMHKASVVQHLYPLLHGTLAFCGMDVLQPIIIDNVTAAERADLEQKVQEYQQVISSIEQFNKYLYKHS